MSVDGVTDARRCALRSVSTSACLSGVSNLVMMI